MCDVEKYLEVCEKIKELETQKEVLRRSIIEGLGSEGVFTLDGHKVIYAQVERNTFDTRSFKRDDPATYMKYLVVSTYGRLEVK